MSLQENASSLLYNGLIEELVDVLELSDNKLIVWFIIISQCASNSILTPI